MVRPHLLTTAIGHGAIAADGIDRFLQDEALEKRPKIDVHHFNLKRKMIEKGPEPSAKCHEPIRGTDESTAAIHNYDDRSDRYVISHKSCSWVTFRFAPRNRREHRVADRRAGAGQLRGARCSLAGGAGRGRGQALHELRPVLRVRQLRGLLPAGRGVQGAQVEVDHRPLCGHRLQPSASAATSAPTSARPATSRWDWGTS